MPREQRRDHDHVLPVIAGGRTSSTYGAARAVAYVALGLVVAAVVCGPRSAAPSAASIESRACVDRTARDQVAELRRVVMERSARTAQLAGTAEPLPAAATNTATAPRPAAPARDPGPRRYTHFEVSSDAVRVTQKPDGTYDVQATDPALAGSLVRAVAVTEAGDEDELIFRVPN